MFLSTVDDLNSGYAINGEQAADSRSPQKAVMICVDFPGLKGEDSEHPEPSFFYDLLAKDGLAVFDAISFGKLRLQVDLVDHWFTMPKRDEEYHMDRVITAETHRAYIQDAMDVSCQEVDYSQYDILYIVPVHGSQVPYSPTMVSKNHPISCASGQIGLAVTFGADMYKRKGKLFAHETGHIYGLPDYYTYQVTEGAEGVMSHIGPWDLMGQIEGLAPDYLAYGKWRLGFLDDDQVVVARQAGEYQLTPLETAGGCKLVVIPLDAYHGYGVEYRTPAGLDAALPEDGLVVYRIDGTIASGQGCLTVIPPEPEKYLKLRTDVPDGLVRAGDTVTRDGIQVHSLGNGKFTYSRVFPTFQEMEYARPDFELRREELRRYAQALKKAGSYAELRQLFLNEDLCSRRYHTMFELAYIRNGINTQDPFYEEEMRAFYQEQGHLALLSQEAAAALLESPFLPEFEKEFGSTVVQDLRVSLKLASPEVVEDMARESELSQAHSRITAGCTTQFRGEECNFYGLLKHMQSTDREERREAFLAWSALYESVSGQLDELYDQMVELRSSMAEKLGFDSFVSMIYAARSHYDYNAEDVARFRKQVKEYVTPLCQRLFERQAKRLGLSRLEWYDESLTSPEGNAVPIGGRAELVAKAQRMYRELSAETGEFFDFMVEHELFDLDSRPGKQTGGYCAFLQEPKAPFIFANFNGTSADVDVLTHEAGHAFESYLSSRTNPLASQAFATSELCEIHSMSMELFTYPWMESFFGEKADQYRLCHLEDALEAVPYIACVDEFQHRVFAERPDAAGRRAIWRELEKTYMPWRNYAGSEFLEGGGFWMQKPHIFINPFYYIDYALAQMGAFEFYQRMCQDREKAWNDYCKLCRIGGSLGYFDALKAVGLGNPFQEGTVRRIMEFLEGKLF